ncbi:GWxTD domain-containing protein [Runella aurantiaca]|uniref:GWxTD domain-containing protein n=1 Tax=Runella aurantiaca TaxID=2282308 RepID=A0A369IA22_9BACT|nr:GWxTD domain-containing protein [Runella aurantiaca]RDB05882.1 GWxTD domain-containing protein [Runella aurantiaca]
MNRIGLILFFLIAVGTFSEAQQTSKTKKRKGDAQTTAAASGVDDVTILGIKSKFLSKDTNSVAIFMRVDLSKPNNIPVRWKDFTDKFTLNYVLYPDFASRERLGYGNIPLNEQNVVQLSATKFMIRFDVKRPVNHATAVMLAEISEIGTTKKVLNDLAVRFNAPKLSDRFALFERTGQVVMLQNYVNVNDTLLIKDIKKTVKPLYVMRYNHDFEAASSPMNTTPRNAPRTLGIDTTFIINTSMPLTFKEEGLYYMTEDTTDATGIGLVVSNKRFPKMTRPVELVRPVMYMSQNQEINELLGTKDAKKSLDRYWLSLMNGNTDLAKRTISVFYNRVEEANRLFTTYKEGWKTDKGMIFIVMGPPDRVQRSKDREVWVYSQRANFSEINFTFNRRANQFVEDHYELQRYVEYQPIWYPMVEAWRTGAVRD